MARRSATKRCAERPFLVYFGYTHCPDVCPTELAHISDVLTKMGDKSIPALFITVDPERDTPKIMQDYVSSFNPHIIGLSGSPQAIGAAEKAYRVFARKGPLQSDGELFDGPQLDRLPDGQERAPSSRPSTSNARPKTRPRNWRSFCKVRKRRRLPARGGV